MTMTTPSAQQDTDETEPVERPRRLASAGSTLRGKTTGTVKSLRKLTVDWLDRPMTSLHLVLAIFALMLGFGLLMVLSSSSVVAFRNGGSSFSVFANQATYAALGLVAFTATQFLPVRLMRSLSTIAVIVSLALLVAVLIPGVGALVNGARSWIRIAGFQFQPSEIAKLALLLWMAHVLAARRSTLRSPKALLIPVLPVFALMAVLIMFQPDLGTTVALTIVFMAVLFFAGAPWWMFGALAAAGVAGFFYLAMTAEYRLARLLSFIDPEAHPDSSYQLLQSLYGMGNGGWFGVGLGQSRAKWSYLPNADSDFIFAIIGEELGLIGTLILLLLFALLAYTGLRIARRNVDPFVKIVASAGTVWLVGQAGINIGYVVGLLPVTGIPLPMISSGGTSLLITMVVFGLLANFARREPQAAAALQAGGGGRLARFLGIKHTETTGRSSLTSRRRRPPTTPSDPGAVRPATARRFGRPTTKTPAQTGSPQPTASRGTRPTARVNGSSPAPRTSGRQPAGQGSARPDQRRQAGAGADPRRVPAGPSRGGPQPTAGRTSGSSPRTTQPRTTQSRPTAQSPRPASGRPANGQPRPADPQPGRSRSPQPRSDRSSQSPPMSNRATGSQSRSNPPKPAGDGRPEARKGLFRRRGGA